MTKRLYSVILVILLSVSPVAAQKFGLSLGTNYQGLSATSLNGNPTTFGRQTGWHAGVWGEVGIGPVAARLGVRYLSAGKLLDGITSRYLSMMESYEITMLDLYLHGRMSFLQTPFIRPYVFAGPVVRRPVGNHPTLKGDLQTMSYAGEVGVGVRLDLGIIKVYPEIAYVFALSKFTERKWVIRGIRFEASKSPRLSMAMVRVSIGM